MASFRTIAPRRVTGDWHRIGKRLNRNTLKLPALPDDIISKLLSKTEKYSCTNLDIDFNFTPARHPNEPEGGWGNITLKSTRDNSDLHIQILISFITIC